MTGRLAGNLAVLARSGIGGLFCGLRTVGRELTSKPRQNRSPPTVQTSRHKDLSWMTWAKSCSSSQTTNAVSDPPSVLGVQAEGPGSARALGDVRLDNGSKQLVVSWQGGQSQTFPFVWLRDNCRCAKCFHPVALARLTAAHELDADLTAASAEMSPGGDGVIVGWRDGHQSRFSADWLAAHRFVDSRRDQLLNPGYEPWGADIDLRSFEFGELLGDDRALHDWLAELVIRGIALVKNTPSEVGQLHKLAGRVAFLRPCNYGPTFQVKTKVDPSNPAYTSGPLALHTDLAYYIRQPGIQMLHCIEQAEGITGGENIFSDGFKVAWDLKEMDPEAFRLLTTVQFEFFDEGTDYYGRFHQYSRHPTIELDELGEISSITISDHSRGPMLRVHPDQVQPAYRALSKYCKMLIEPQNVLEYKMETGDIATFNNRRALHGRSAFQVTKASGRHLEGGYLEWDEVNSRLRVLGAELQSKQSEEIITPP